MPQGPQGPQGPPGPSEDFNSKDIRLVHCSNLDPLLNYTDDDQKIWNTYDPNKRCVCDTKKTTVRIPEDSFNRLLAAHETLRSAIPFPNADHEIALHENAIKKFGSIRVGETTDPVSSKDCCERRVCKQNGDEVIMWTPDRPFR